MKYVFLFQSAMYLSFGLMHFNNIEEFTLRWGFGVILGGIAAVLHKLEEIKK